MDRITLLSKLVVKAGDRVLVHTTIDRLMPSIEQFLWARRTGNWEIIDMSDDTNVHLFQYIQNTFRPQLDQGRDINEKDIIEEIKRGAAEVAAKFIEQSREVRDRRKVLHSIFDGASIPGEEGREDQQVNRLPCAHVVAEYESHYNAESAFQAGKSKKGEGFAALRYPQALKAVNELCAAPPKEAFTEGTNPSPITPPFSIDGDDVVRHVDSQGKPTGEKFKPKSMEDKPKSKGGKKKGNGRGRASTSNVSVDDLVSLLQKKAGSSGLAKNEIMSALNINAGRYNTLVAQARDEKRAKMNGNKRSARWVAK